jgi:L-aspartate oxidase
MWLDGRHLGAEEWEHRFPTILASCRSHGVDPLTDLIPVAPACHYASGGVATDLWGRTSVPGLYATGEVACSGVHGANRLASNSLLEGLVFSRRIAEVLPTELRPWHEPGPDERRPGLVGADVRGRVQETMSARVGVLRTAVGLRLAAADLDQIGWDAVNVNQAAWENSNLVTVARVLTAAASAREETRGSHWREDHPERNDRVWAGHFDAVPTLSQGRLAVELPFTPTPATDPA